MKNRMLVSKAAVLGAVLATVGVNLGAALAADGYVSDSQGGVVRSGAALCWRTGFWTPAMATTECDPDIARVKAPDRAPSPKPEAKMAPRPVATQPEVLSLSSDGLFAFGKSTLVPESQEKLNALAAKLKAGKFSKITVTGHTDRLGSKKGNLKLSLQRAEAVKAFLVGKGIDASKIATYGKGSGSPKTAAGSCKGKKSPKLIACLQPDRRVEISVSP